LRRYSADTDTDRQIQDLLAKASRFVEDAVRVAQAAPGQGHTKRKALRDLDTALGALRSVRPVGTTVPTEDPDLVPEAERNRRHRDKLRDERRKEVTDG
jgi:hypothetical protein